MPMDRVYAARDARIPALPGRIAILIGFLALGVVPLRAAQETTWEGSFNTDWFEDGNWSDDAPGPGARVTVNAGAEIVLNASTADMADFTMNGGTLTFSNGWETVLNATNVTIAGTITHPVQSATTTNEWGGWTLDHCVWIDCETLTITSAGTIDVTGKGYTSGMGPGGGLGDTAGASHGGQAGSGGIVYGSVEVPVDPGSGGAGSGDQAGGGVVRITASGSVVIDGTIEANGRPGASYRGCGSGGSVFIECVSIDGDGTIQANGGGVDLAYTHGGGGGRIAVIYDPDEQANLAVPGILFQTAGGSTRWSHGEGGTLYFPNHRFLINPLRHSGQWMAPGWTGWTLDSLELDNAWLRFPSEGFALTVTNDITFTGTGLAANLAPRAYGLELNSATVLCGGDLKLNSASLTVYGGRTTLPRIDIDGHLMLTNGMGGNTSGGYLDVHAGVTNGAAAAYGAEVVVDGDITIANGSVIRPSANPTNGAIVAFFSEYFTVASGGMIDADLRGYAPWLGPGGSGGASYAGGSHGGHSGDGGSSTNGNYMAPLFPGSGGTHSTRAYGGGAVRLVVAETLTLDGTIRANGGTGDYWGGGGGSGGSIYLTCRTLAGNNGTVSADGGTGYSNVNSWSAGGGGGRIAVIYDPLSQASNPMPDIQFSALGGLGGQSGLDHRYGEIGTLFFPDNRLLANPIVHSGQWMVHDFHEWSPDSLEMNNVCLRFPYPDFILNVTNNVTVTGSDVKRHGLQMVGGRLRSGGDMFLRSAHFNLIEGGETAIGGNLTLTNAPAIAAGAWVIVNPAPTNTPVPDYGAHVAVDGEMYVSADSTVYPLAHSVNGATVRFDVGDLTVAHGGLIEANRRGFEKELGPGGSDSHSIGASHGGRGAGNAKDPYGCEFEPVEPGSGSSSYPGGGAVRIHAARQIALEGSILANGGGGAGWNSGASGGSVYLTCRTFTGSFGVIRADGGSITSDHGSAGGGGRIAIWRRYHEWSAPEENVTALGGDNPNVEKKGEDGTIYWGWIQPTGTMIIVR